MPGVFLTAIACITSPSALGEYSMDPAYTGLRNLALGSKAEEILGHTGKPHEVFGAIFEIGMENGVATIVSMADGSISIYTSSGGGFLGLQRDEQVRKSARTFLLDSRSYLGSMKPVSNYPVPAFNHVHFYVLTVDGVMFAESNEADIRKRGNPLSVLYEDAQRLIFDIQRTAKQRN